MRFLGLDQETKLSNLQLLELRSRQTGNDQRRRKSEPTSAQGVAVWWPGRRGDVGFDLPIRCVVHSGPYPDPETGLTTFKDVLKTRVQTWDLSSHLQSPTVTQPLLSGQHRSAASKSSEQLRPSTFRIAQEAYATEGVSVFFRGIGICSARAFIVNAVQWAVSRQTFRYLKLPN